VNSNLQPSCLPGPKSCFLGLLLKSPSLVFTLFAALALAGCGKSLSHSTSRSDWTINDRRTITKTTNGLSRKIETTKEVEFHGAQVTKFPKGTVISLQETGSSEARQAELRENANQLELWIKEKDNFRKATAADDAWLQRFLDDVMAK
jgi:hypothetical protein